MIKIDLITGFLGAGKTTFIRKYVKYLTDSGYKVGVIENDFGAINIDMLVLQDLQSEKCEVEQIVGGNVVSDWMRRFKAKLISMAMRGFNRILVEPSGIFDVDAFFDMLYEEPVCNWYEAGSVFTIVDANISKDLSKESRFLLVSQAANAGCILLSKTTLATKQEVEDTKAYLQQVFEEFHCDRSLQNAFMEKDWDQLTSQDFEKLVNCGLKKADHEKLWFDKTNTYDSLFFMHVVMDEKTLKDTIKQLFENKNMGKIIRIKGFVEVSEGVWLECNATKEEQQYCYVEKGQSVIIVIGEALQRENIAPYFPIEPTE